MQYVVTDKVATVAFDRPDKANALDIPAWHALRESMVRADADDEVNVVILTGYGKHFCAGIDLKVLTDLNVTLAGKPDELEAEIRTFISDLQDCITAIERCRKPVIAQVHGGCIGGGVDIITACDMRFCTHDTSFSVKEIDLGILADLGTLQRLPNLVSPGIAAELAFTARRFDGKEAQLIGLVNESVKTHDQLLYRVGQVADAIAAKPPRIVTAIKKSLLHQRNHTVAEGLKYVADYSARLMSGK